MASFHGGIRSNIKRSVVHSEKQYPRIYLSTYDLDLELDAGLVFSVNFSN